MPELAGRCGHTPPPPTGGTCVIAACARAMLILTHPPIPPSLTQPPNAKMEDPSGWSLTESDPQVFSELLRQLGVKGLQVVSARATISGGRSFRPLRPVFHNSCLQPCPQSSPTPRSALTCPSLLPPSLLRPLPTPLTPGRPLLARPGHARDAAPDPRAHLPLQVGRWGRRRGLGRYRDRAPGGGCVVSQPGE